MQVMGFELAFFKVLIEFYVYERLKFPHSDVLQIESKMMTMPKKACKMSSLRIM